MTNPQDLFDMSMKKVVVVVVLVVVEVELR